MPPFGATEGENSGCPEFPSSSLMRDRGAKAGVSGTVFRRPLKSLPRERKAKGARERDGVSGTPRPGLEDSLSDVVIVSPSLLRLGAAMVGTMKDGDAGADICPVPEVESFDEAPDDMRGRMQLDVVADGSLFLPF